MKTLLLLIALTATTAAGCGAPDELPATPVCQDGPAWGLVITSCPSAPGYATCARETASGSRGTPAVDCTPAAAYEAPVMCVRACPDSPRADNVQE